MTYRTAWRAELPLLQAIEEVLTEIADPAVAATSLVKDNPDTERTTDGNWALLAYTEEPISAGTLELLPKGTPPHEEEELPDRDWVAHALEGLGVVRAGPFVLYGSHDADKVASEDGIKLQIEANQAFGTGHHPTTAGCLDVLGDLETTPGRVLDIGTGSGVLAIALRKMFAGAEIIATDIDERSTQIAEENAGINEASGITFGVAAGTDHELIRASAPYHLVFANILAGPLKELAPDIQQVTADGGTIILAGLLDEQMQGVLSTYQELGFTLHKTGGTPRWPTLVMTKGTTA
ncbi:50S ribosomal protein L11 methyltransferase [Parvularcula maris]|uniref:50S ribosomal protein L11 methyltransferase n=1 Tax=Parvularcula maris TaxID=2965077 RepID=A0A9X2L8W4_9PROT|nr:50S ribosomal protein L11 methyltransferase [Parvularcula maris]MCQ8185241.1 50S ribosomal protein L11 methyltransferase [Parvularcula maris]